MKRTWLIIGALVLSLATLAETAFVQPTSADIKCSQLRGCTGAAGCFGPGDVNGCQLICQGGGTANCDTEGGLE
jgi:hypothetical protein